MPLNANDIKPLQPHGKLPVSWFSNDDVQVWAQQAIELTEDLATAKAYVYFRGFDARYTALTMTEAAKQKLGDDADEFTQAQLDAIAKERDKWLAQCADLVPEETPLTPGAIGGAVLTAVGVG